MKSYELVKEYPGSPQLGKVITSTTHEWFTHQPEKYPEFWEETASKVAIRTVDGVDLHVGETCWMFNTNCTVSHFIISKFYLDGGFDREVFSSREAAEKHLIDEINIPLEDCVLLGCNVPIYSLLPKAGWDERETTSLELWIRLKMGRNTANWKYFRNKEARDKYISDNKPMFSLEQVKFAFAFQNVPLHYQIAVVHELKSIVKTLNS
jgi:hypothetical protein